MFLFFLQGIWEYIQSTRDQVQDLQSRVQHTKNNVEEVQKLMGTWSKNPLFTRKEEKNDCLLNLTDREDRLRKRYEEIKNIGEQIHGLVQVSKAFTIFLEY
jgi:dynein heavy chain